MNDCCLVVVFSIKFLTVLIFKIAINNILQRVNSLNITVIKPQLTQCPSVCVFIC